MHGLIPTDLSLITPPVLEPLTLFDVKQALRFTSTAEDALLERWIPAARQMFEDQTGRQVITATWEYWLDQCPSRRAIELPRPPLQSVISLKYDDASGTEQTVDVDDYVVISPSGTHATRGRLVLREGGTWPTTAANGKAVRIRFKAGYGLTPATVPALVQSALLFLVGHLHRNRAEVTEAVGLGLHVTPMGASQMMRSFQQTALPVLEPR